MVKLVDSVSGNHLVVIPYFAKLPEIKGVYRLEFTHFLMVGTQLTLKNRG